MARNGKNTGTRNSKPDPNGKKNTAQEAGESKSPFRYYVKGEKTRSDGAFLELLLSRVFLMDGAIPDFDSVWPRGTSALSGLNVFRLSQYSSREMENAIGTVGGEFSRRLGKRSQDVVAWAEAFRDIQQVYGSFLWYLHSFEVDGYEALIGDLSQRLIGLSPEFLLSYLRAAGEKIPVLPEFERPPRQRPAKGRGGSGRSRGSSGTRRRSGRGGNQKKPASPPKPSDHTANGTANGTGKKRRGRGFFRRRRGKNDKPSSTSSTSQQS